MSGQGSTPPPQTTTSPAQPGVYWFRSETAQWEVLVEVRVKRGELIVGVLNEDIPVASLIGRWRGPISPPTDPTSRLE